MSKPRAHNVGQFHLNIQPGRTLATEVTVPVSARFYAISAGAIQFYPAPQDGSSLPQDVVPLPDEIDGGSIIFVYTRSKRGGNEYKLTTFPVNPHLLRIYGMTGVSATEIYINASSNGGMDGVLIPWIKQTDVPKIPEYHEFWIRERSQLG